MTPTRISLLTEIPAPFRIPLFNALAARKDVELSVLFLSRRDPKRLHYEVYESEFRHRWRVLGGRELVRGGRWIVLSRGVLRALRRDRPDVIVIGGWNQPAFWLALGYARLARKPLVAWVESTARDTRAEAPRFERPKRLLIDACAGFLVPGRAAREYLRSLGVPDDRIATAPNAVDTAIFGRGVEQARGRRDEFRAAHGLEGCVFLYVGRLDHEKGVDVLLEAAHDVPAMFVVIGSGSEEDALRAAAPANVRFEGRRSREELPEWLAAADVFVLPSRSDQWGMVLNEAALAGLPLVATDAPGAAHDLIEEGVNGFRVPTGDMNALAEALRRLATDAELRIAAGARSKSIGGRFTPEAWADAVVALATGLPRPRSAGRP